MIKNFLGKNIYQFSSKFQKGGKQQLVRVRYAPSPTGDVHLGGLRTALYNYLFAKKNKGKFILRIEDTDKNREVQGSIKSLIDMLNWSGIKYDEGPLQEKNLEIDQEIKQQQQGEVGDYGPYHQSNRLHIYQQYAKKLVESGDAYYCFCSSERLKTVREEQQKEKKIPQYDKHCLSLEQDQINDRLKNKQPYTIRLNVREGQTTINDIIHGQITFQHTQVDDQVLLKSDGYPTYHLANVVDDYLMRITHVIRGEEWLTSTPKHVIIYDALNIKPPQFAHLPLLVNPNGKKLSKRQSDQSVQYFKDKLEIQKEALLNFIGLLGWSPMTHDEAIAKSKNGKLKVQDELLSLQDMEDMFSLERVRGRNSVVDKEKLVQMNGYYLKQKYHFLFNNDEIFTEFQDLVFKQFNNNDINNNKEILKKIKQTSTPNLIKIFTLILERMQISSDILQFKYFWQTPVFPNDFNETQHKKFFKKNEILSQQLLKDFTQIFEKLQHNWDKDEINKELGTYLYQSQQSSQPLKNEDVYHFVRFIVSGNKNGPPAGEICEILGYQEVQKRIAQFQN